MGIRMNSFQTCFMIICSTVCGLLLLTAILAGCGRQEKTALSKNGSCGENLSFEYNALSKTLTISGSGDMETPKFFFSDYSINKLIIEEGVTSISPNAFYSNRRLEGELKLPSTLKKNRCLCFLWL
ncbi:MAG: hypothetical protein Q4A19_01285 [Johnsonella sp.]|nr:hypothetical protein [Johnsonella sp.]